MKFPPPIYSPPTRPAGANTFAMVAAVAATNASAASRSSAVLSTCWRDPAAPAPAVPASHSGVGGHDPPLRGFNQAHTAAGSAPSIGARVVIALGSSTLRPPANQSASTVLAMSPSQPSVPNSLRPL